MSGNPNPAGNENDEKKPETPAPAPSPIHSYAGIGFIIFGGLLLVLANHLLNSPTVAHPVLIFVIVVLGAAILLYGTGTQGAGSLVSGDNLWKYNVSIAGGAGVMALLIGYGMVNFDKPMRAIFTQDKKVAELRVFLSLTSGDTDGLHAHFRNSQNQLLNSRRETSCLDGKGCFYVLLPFTNTTHGERLQVQVFLDDSYSKYKSASVNRSPDLIDIPTELFEKAARFGTDGYYSLGQDFEFNIQRTIDQTAAVPVLQDLLESEVTSSVKPANVEPPLLNVE